MPAFVAPLAGAWIEICVLALLLDNFRVAPLAGAWIEIQTLKGRAKGKNSRSPRGSVD